MAVPKGRRGSGWWLSMPAATVRCVTLTAGLLEWLPQASGGQWVGNRCYVTAGPRAASRLI